MAGRVKRKSAKRSANRRPTIAERVARHRAELRAKGMRLVQIRVAETRSPAFIAEARRQSRAAARAFNRPRSGDRAQLEAWSKIAATEDIG
ncbi:MAG: antitoxin MazE-like protein [Dongiaceae bacterium]